MATNMTNSATVAYLNFITRELNRYIPLLFLFLGTVGNILNITVFTRPSLRTNPCSLYFISGNIANFISLYVGLITPFLGLYNLDPTQKYDVLCKTRFYLRFVTITLSTWFILFACVDRFLSSSANVHYRSWSSLRLAKRLILITSVICLIFPYTQVFYCYSISPQKICANQYDICEITVDGVLLICNSGLPPMLMVLVSILTIHNVKYSTRINPGHRRDIQLIRILFIQVIILVLFALPTVAQKIYNDTTIYKTKSQLTMAIDSLLSQISTEILYINSSTTFYIYSITSKKFRKEVIQILSSVFTCQWKKTNIIQPVPVTLKLNRKRNQ
jgi:hypothetical protein